MACTCWLRRQPDCRGHSTRSMATSARCARSYANGIRSNAGLVQDDAHREASARRASCPTHRPAFGRAGAFCARSAVAASSAASPRFSSGCPRCAWSTTELLLSVRGASFKRGWSLPLPVGGWFFLFLLVFAIPRQQQSAFHSGLECERRCAATGGASRECRSSTTYRLVTVVR
jgi:hypothetical protein